MYIYISLSLKSSWLYTLNLSNVMYQLYFNKAGGKKKCRFSGLTTELLNQNSLGPRNLCFQKPSRGFCACHLLPKSTPGTSVVTSAGNGEGWGGWRSEFSSTVPFSKIGARIKSPKDKGVSLFSPPPVDVLTDFFIPAFLLKSEPL